MPETPSKPDDPEKLLRQYALNQQAFQQVLNEMGTCVSSKRFKLALMTLGIHDALLLRANPRLKHALNGYLYFTDRRRGSTIFESWYKAFIKQSARRSAAFNTVVNSLAQFRYSVFEIESVHVGLGVGVRDVLTGDQHLMVDQRMSENWHVGMQFGDRISILPEFTMLLSEPLESAVRPGQNFTGGQITAEEQAKLEAAVIEMFRDALLSC